MLELAFAALLTAILFVQQVALAVLPNVHLCAVLLLWYVVAFPRLVPLILPMLSAYGISEVQFGVIMVLNLMIGLMTPPYGQSLFMLSGTTGVHFNKVVKYVMPWLLPMFIALLVVTLVEPVTLAIPVMLGYEVW